MRNHPDFELLEEIHKGIFTTIWRAKNVHTGQDVAIKELTDEARKDPELRQLLHYSSQFLSNLSSYDHIVRINTLIPDNDWLVFELMAGSLREHMESNARPLEASLVRSVLQQALQGLKVLHKASKLHGNLHPGNLLIDAHGRVKLADSPGLLVEGVVRPPENLPKYVAPERFDNEFGNVGPACDLYSLGFSVLELLHGPGFDDKFKGTGKDSIDPLVAWQRLHASQQESIPPAVLLVPGLPKVLASLIDKMLQKKVADRFQSADQVLVELGVTTEVRIEMPKRHSSPEIIITTAPALNAVPPSSSSKLHSPLGQIPLHGAPNTKPKSTQAQNENTKDQLGRIDSKNRQKIWVACGVVAVCLLLGLGIFASLRLSGTSGRMTVRIETDPPGATIFFLEPTYPNVEKSSKLTPNDYNFSAVPHKIRLEFEGYNPKIEEFDPTKTQLIKSILTKKGDDITSPPPSSGDTKPMPRIIVKVTFKSQPEGIQVFIDGVLKGSTPVSVDLKPGRPYELRYRKDGYRENPPENYTPPEGVASAEKFVLLQDDFVLVTIQANPIGTRLHIDDKEFTPGVPIKLPPGKHVALLKHEKYESLRQEFIVKMEPPAQTFPFTLIAIVPEPQPDPATGNLLVAPFTEARAKEVQIAVAKTLQKEVEEKEDLGEKDLKLEMVLIPAGKFLMGSPASEKGRNDDEVQHEVTITKPFYMGKYEVTEEQWGTVMKNQSYVNYGAKFPVTNVSWEDCQEFIKKLNQKTKGGYRLPTEAEWEYACRAGTTTAYSSGDSLTKFDANFLSIEKRNEERKEAPKKEEPRKEAPKEEGRKEAPKAGPDNLYAGLSLPRPGRYKPNVFGLYDMHGNAAEWCEDWYGAYPAGVAIDPKGPAKGDSRVLRGGSFITGVSIARSSQRDPTSYPTLYGIRLARQADFKVTVASIVPKPDPADVMPTTGNLLVAPFTEARAKEVQKAVAMRLQKGVEEKEDLGKEVKLEMVLIPAGKFLMGSPASEKGRKDNENQHEVTQTKPYYMGKYEVTQDQWESVMGNNPSQNRGLKLPVTNVSWEDCQEFIKKLNAKTSGGYSLPTESEWEYACRAGTTTAYSFEDGLTKFNASIDDNDSSAKAVGIYKPNAFGLYDMHGNVREWCEDWKADYPVGAVTDPKGPATGEYRVLRGGSFFTFVSTARSSDRASYAPTGRTVDTGFRLVREADFKAKTIPKPDSTKFQFKEAPKK